MESYFIEIMKEHVGISNDIYYVQYDSLLNPRGGVAPPFLYVANSRIKVWNVILY